MEIINDVLRSKGHEVFSISPDATVFEALRSMAQLNVGALMVRDDSGRLVGIFSERDYARKIILRGKSSRETKVEEIMTPRVFYIKVNQTIEEGMALMTKNKCRHLPVLDDDEELVGVISIGDIVKAVIHEKDFLIDQLEHYISGSL
jgi:CBS domain-containing protein